MNFGGMGNMSLRAKMDAMIKEEGAAAILTPSRGKDGTLVVGSSGSMKVGDPEGIPRIVVAREHYNRLVRIAKSGVPIKMEVEVKTRFHEEDTTGYNVVGEIPGTDLKDEVVLIGGHIDAWHGATGSTDNAAGCCVALEAVRILKAIDAKPRRTIRVVLWDGEEQGLFGSRGYVEKHYVNKDGSQKPDHEKMNVYFNYDNGTGKIRGVYIQGIEEAIPIFNAVFDSLGDLTDGTIAMFGTAGTDIMSFNAAGLPGFQWIQDPIAYQARTWHTNMDDVDHLLPEDLRQSATVSAAMIYHCAMREERFPRKPPIEVAKLTDEQLQAITGHYRMFTLELDLLIEDGIPYLTSEQFPRVNLIALSPSKFLIQMIEAEINFEFDENGKATQFSMEMSNGMKLVCKRVEEEEKKEEEQ
jgi:hypothetical protein